MIKQISLESDIWRYKCIDAYKSPNNNSEWYNCPNCGLKPLIWEYDNGRSTACGCGKNEYNHFSIKAESINSCVLNSKNGKSLVGYKSSELMDNWNHWVLTGEILFIPKNDRW